MKPGEIRGPVKTEFGWHVIKLESASPETVRSFEEVRAELEPEYRRSQVDKTFGDAQERLDTLAFEAGSDIGSVASKMGLSLKHVERYTRAGSAELGATPKLTQAVFSPEVLAGREIRTVELAPGKVVAVAVKEHRSSAAKPLADVRAEVVESARMEAAGRLAAARAGEAVTALQGGAAWAASVGLWRGDGATMNPRPVGRQDESVPAEVREVAFRAQAPAGQPRYGVATLKNGDTAIWTVTAMEKGKVAALAQDARRTTHDESRDRKAMSDATVYVTAMRAAADVDVNPQVFE
jgi:peptidyl-prolyl cis-trans isomerase D